jgi:transcriptional regulator with XRE-family HTH domain
MRSEQTENASAAERLAGELREIRDKAGLTLRRLERHTHVSDSSLSRYFAGRALPPWPVVESMARLAERDPRDLRPLWEAAGKEPARSLVEDQQPPNDASPAGRRRSPWLRTVAVFSTGLMMGGLGGAVLSWLPGDDPPATSGTDLTITNAEPPARDDGYAQVSLLTAGTDGSLIQVWSRTIPCATPAEYRRVFELPVQAIDKATAYLLPHTDCTVKLFREAGGKGFGEKLVADGRGHVLSAQTSYHAMAVVTYSKAEN